MMKIFLYLIGGSLILAFIISAGIFILPFLLIYMIYKLLSKGENRDTAIEKHSNIQIEIDNSLENNFSNRLLNITDGISFEHFCADLLKANGFLNIVVTPNSNDFGIDITGETSDHVKYAFQCKYYSGSLNNSSVQEVSAGMAYYNCHVGVVITNSFFYKKCNSFSE